MQVFGDVSLLKNFPGHGNLLAFLRNLPEMSKLYSEYCFECGSRGRGNGKISTSILAGSNIWLADEYQCVIVCQSLKGRGPLVIRIYVANDQQTYLSDEIMRIVRQYNLPYINPDSP